MIELSDLLEAKERTTNEANQILFRLSDDERFRNLVNILNTASEEELDKIEDYTKLVIGANQ